MFPISSWQKSLVLGILLVIFASFFVVQIKSDLPLIFKKDLYAHDESSNSTVIANITRKFFPPMVRTNPLVEKRGNWMEGPFWQHIPPLFAYVPLVPFLIDGKVTIEVKRLSFAFISFLTGIIFIISVFLFEKKFLAGVAATIAAILWAATPFSRELITGIAFGVSDILLAFTIICSFAAVCFYLRKPKESRVNYPIWELCLIGFVLSLPVLAKSLLGAIPLATYFILFLTDYKKINKKIILTAGFILFVFLIYFGGLFISSPQTFKSEVFVSFLHIGEYEGWGRPWHYFLTNYLPQRYLGNFSAIYYLALIFGIILLLFRKIQNRTKTILILSLSWFLMNLLVVSLIRSKVPNFIYQSYLLSLFFVLYAPVAFFSQLVFALFEKLTVWFEKRRKPLAAFLILIFLLSFGFFTNAIIGLAKEAKNTRASFYAYNSEHEKFYQFAEHLQDLKVSNKDIFVINTSNDDCWFRYYILFLTGAESKTLLELSFDPNDYSTIKQKYENLYFLINKNDLLPQQLPKYDYDKEKFENYAFIKFDLTLLSQNAVNNIMGIFLKQNANLIARQIELFKKDKTSCQWLIPDQILNAE